MFCSCFRWQKWVFANTICNIFLCKNKQYKIMANRYELVFELSRIAGEMLTFMCNNACFIPDTSETEERDRIFDEMMSNCTAWNKELRELGVCVDTQEGEYKVTVCSK